MVLEIVCIFVCGDLGLWKDVKSEDSKALKLQSYPGMKAVSSFPLLSLTRTHFLFPELGFLGLRTVVLITTPLALGIPCPSGFLLGRFLITGPLRWL